MGRLLRGAATALAAVALASRAYRKLAEARDARRYPPPGEMVDIGGRRLHLCRAREGTPSVVIVPCLSGPGSEWWDVQRKLASYTSVYTYDRAGTGWSDIGPWPRTFAVMADELHQLLTAAAIPPPYLLVGHSTGGIISRQYAARHPEGLAGLVLVDSSHEAQNYRLAPYRENRPHDLRLAAWKLLRPLGLIRAAQDLGFRARPAGPVAAMAETARQGRADAQELLGHALTGPGAIPPDLGDLPLLVITAGSRGDDYGGTWQELQAGLAASSTCSTHILAAHAGHHVHRDDSDLVVQAIHDLIAKLRP